MPEGALRSRYRRYLREPLQDTDRAAVDLPEEEAVSVLRSGEVLGGYRMPWGSNYTFLVGIEAGPGKYLRAIYKPRDGERPLYDFPRDSLYKREYAAFVLSRDLGWPNVPPTVIRDGPHGVGAFQLFIPCDPEITYFDLIDDRAEELRWIAAFDLLVNNADRKAGHCLLGEDGRIWSIDHGLTFHSMLKLRTVMLEFWGQPLPQAMAADLKSLVSRLESADGELGELLTPRELEALNERAHAMVDRPVFPTLDPYRNVPWPWV